MAASKPKMSSKKKGTTLLLCSDCLVPGKRQQHFAVPLYWKLALAPTVPLRTAAKTSTTGGGLQRNSPKEASNKYSSKARKEDKKYSDSP